MTEEITWPDFAKVEIHVGTILSAVAFQKAKKPSYIVTIDFGALGIKKSSAQITKLYSCSELVGMQIVAVTNFPPKQISNIMSECLVLGIVQGADVTLLIPDKSVKNGSRIL